MNTILTHLLAVGVGGVLVIVAFVVFNVKSPEKVDSAEAFVRAKLKK